MLTPLRWDFYIRFTYENNLGQPYRLILFSIFYYECVNEILSSYSWREGGPGKKKTSLAYIKVQPVMESLFFTALKNLRLCLKYNASKFGGIVQSHTKYRELKWPKTALFDQYFQKYLSVSVQTFPKVRFYQVLLASICFTCRNVEILKT